MTSLTGVRVMPTVGERGSVNARGHSFSTIAELLDIDPPTWDKDLV